MNIEKINRELDKINGQMKALSDRRKELEGKKKAAIDAELVNVFTRRKIDQEEFMIFSRLNDNQLRTILAQAEKMAESVVPEKTDILSDVKESVNV